MVFLFPLLLIVFICLLIAKLAGATITWGLVFLPLAIVCILMLLFSLMGSIMGKKKQSSAKEPEAAKPAESESTTDENTVENNKSEH